MDSIYLNNFRGFSNTTIQFCPVNFLVGENSTGKTSVLSIFNLLSSPNFWINLNFNTGDYEFGGYHDIVSVESSDNLEFQIGLHKQKQKEDEYNTCYMMHFREDKNGLPKLVRLSQIRKDYILTVKIDNNKVSALGIKKLNSCLDCSDVPGCFKMLKELPFTHTRGYKTLPKDLASMVISTPVLMFSNVVEYVFQGGKQGNDSDFPFPSLSSRPIASLAPIRTKPKRTYDGYVQRYSSEGNHTPYLLRANLAYKGSSSFRTALDSFGRESGLFSSVTVSKYGRDNSAPFELLVNLSKSSSLRMNSVGYGVSQALPVVAELLARPDNTWFTVQQPEVHLHPRAQAALGDLFFQVAATHNKVLFVETHSDYLLDRFRLNYKTNVLKEGFAQILYFERVEGVNTINPIQILPDGEYPDVQPKGFRSFFLEEQRKLLGF